MKIDPAFLDSMFAIADVSKDNLHQALRQMGIKHLHPPMRAAWSADNPTKNYCYVVSEYAYWFKAPAGTVAMGLKIPGFNELHRYLSWPCGCIVDLTCDQFPDYRQVNYAAGRPKMFLQCAHKGPSKRAVLLAELLHDKEKATPHVCRSQFYDATTGCWSVGSAATNRFV